MSDIQLSAIAAALNHLKRVKDPIHALDKSLHQLTRDPSHHITRQLHQLTRDPSKKISKSLNRLANPRSIHQ